MSPAGGPGGGGRDEPPKKKYPRASWEAPDPDDAIPTPAAPQVPSSGNVDSSSVSAGWATASEPSVVVDPEPPAPVAASDPATSAYASSDPYTSIPSPVTSTALGPVETIVPTASGAYTTAADDPLLPLPTSLRDDDGELRMAVGATPVKQPKHKPPPPANFDDDTNDDDQQDGDRPGKRSGKLMLFAILVGVLGLGIAALVIFGNLNKQRYQIACEPQQVIAKQGRGFPPWGERAIASGDDDKQWKPIQIPPEAECRERDTEDVEELSRWYLEILVDRASTMLTAREVTAPGGKGIDDAAAMLEQALLHARAPDRREQRRDIERLLGDVGYWRASAKLKDASTALSDAAKQFDAAAAQRPRHVSDASAWATYVRKLVDQLSAGPNGEGTAFPPIPVSDRKPSPPGTALPVEPQGSAGSAEPPPAPIDAGLPTGGVLL